jgi:hypothetical protein
MTSKSMGVIVAAVVFTGIAANSGSPQLGNAARWNDTVRVHDTLPPGHPPVPSLQLPEGHPPIDGPAPQLPEGHPPIPWPRHGCPGMEMDGGFDGSDIETGREPEVIST